MAARDYGSGKQVRDILYASDVAKAFLAFFKNGEAGIYNVGGVRRIHLTPECISLMEKATGSKSRCAIPPARFGDLNYFVCDPQKLREFELASGSTTDCWCAALIDWVQAIKKSFKLEARRLTTAPKSTHD